MTAVHRTERSSEPPEPSGPPGPLLLRVPVDPDEDRSTAELLAAAVAASADATIQLEVAPTGGAPVGVRLAERCQQLRDLGAPEVGWRRLGDGRVADAILAGEHGPHTLVCMAVGSRHAPGSMLFSSVTEEVLRRSPVPVLVAGPRMVPPTHRPTRVVAAADGSEVAAGAIDVAADLATRLGAPLRILRVEPPPPARSLPRPPAIVRGGPVDLVEAADPVGAILGSLGDEPTILVIGAHKRAGARRFALGSVALDLVRGAPCPVLVVPSGAARP